MASVATAASSALTRIDPTTLRAASSTNPTTSPTQTIQAKARAKAEDFEAVFLNSMFQQMYTGIDGDGPFGGGTGVGVWRSFLTDQFAKSMVKAGGIGIANDVYRSLLAQQEIATK
jgi:Rod binding domain-containing protein